MADVQIQDLISAYDAEIGRLTGELLRTRLALAATQTSEEAAAEPLSADL